MSYVNSQRQKHLVLLNCSLIWCSPPYFFIRGSIVLGKNVLDGVSAKSWHVVTLPVLNNYFVLTSVFSNNYVHRCSYCISLCASFCKAHLVRALRTIFKVLTRVNRITSYVAQVKFFLRLILSLLDFGWLFCCGFLYSETTRVCCEASNTRDR